MLMVGSNARAKHEMPLSGLPLTSRAELGPNKRLRGLRRRLSRPLRGPPVDLLPRDYADLWHWHPDSTGYSNTCADLRRRNLYCLLRGLVTHGEWAQGVFPRFQAFVLVAPDARDDALYLHTPNPNRSPFPLPLAAVRSNGEWERIVRAAIEGHAWCVDEVDDPEGTSLYLWSPSIGEPLRSPPSDARLGHQTSAIAAQKAGATSDEL